MADTLTVTVDDGGTYTIDVRGVDLFTDTGLTTPATFPTSVSAQTTWYAAAPGVPGLRPPIEVLVTATDGTTIPVQSLRSLPATVDAVEGQVDFSAPAPAGNGGSSADGIFVATLGSGTVAPGDPAIALTFDATSLQNIRGDGITPVPAWASVNGEGALVLAAGVYVANAFHRPNISDASAYSEFQINDGSLIWGNAVTRNPNTQLTIPGSLGFATPLTLPVVGFTYVAGPMATYHVGNGDVWYDVIKLA